MKKAITEQEAYLQLAALCAQAEHCEQEMRANDILTTSVMPEPL